MLKRITLLQRREDMEPSAFDARWAAHSAVATRVPGVLGYVQHPVRRALIEGGHRLDGILELWVADLETLIAAYADTSLADLRASEQEFLSGVTLMAVHESGTRAEGGLVRWVISDDPLPAMAGALAHRVGLVTGRPGLAMQPVHPAGILRLPPEAEIPAPPGPGRFSVYETEVRVIRPLTPPDPTLRRPAGTAPAQRRPWPATVSPRR